MFLFSIKIRNKYYMPTGQELHKNITIILSVFCKIYHYLLNIRRQMIRSMIHI